MLKHASIPVLLLLVVVAILTRLPWVAVPLDNDTGEHAFHARQILRGEILYGKFHPAHHLPGIYYTYVLALSLFGDSPTAPKILLLFFVSATCILIYKMGEEFINKPTGFLGGIFYALVSSQAMFSGTTAAREHFANLPLTATMFVFLWLIKRNSRALTFVWIGVLSALAALYNIIYVAPLITAGVVLIVTWKQHEGIRGAFTRIAAIGFGTILPLLLAGSYFASKGLWSRLILVFEFGFSYFTSSDLSPLIFPKPFGFPLFITAVNNAALLTFGLMGTYRLFRNRQFNRSNSDPAFLSFVLWTLTSLALTGMRGGGYEHYALIALPPLCITAGYEIVEAYHRLQSQQGEKQAYLVSGFMTLLVVVLFLKMNLGFYIQYAHYLINPSPTADLGPFGKYYQSDSVNYLHTHTTPDDHIYLWSNGIQLYYYADRQPPVDILMPEYVSATGPRERIFDANTKYIILDPKLPAPQWLVEGLSKYYTFDTNISGWDFYRRNGQ